MAATTRREISISGNWRKGGPAREWAGSGTVDRHGAIECSANLDGDAYDQIEEQIADGDTDGSVTVTADDGREITYHWAMAGCHDMIEPIPGNCLPPLLAIASGGFELDADGRIVCGLYAGKTPAEVLADRDRCNRLCGE